MARMLITLLAKTMALVNSYPESGFVDEICAMVDRRLREAYPPMARMMIERGQALAAISGQGTDAVRLALVAAFENTDEISHSCTAGSGHSNP
jgi:hypothetical protein